MSGVGVGAREAEVRYEVGPLVVACALALPELPSLDAASDTAGRPRAHIAAVEALPPATRELYADVGGEGSLVIARTDRGYRIDFASYAAFHLAVPEAQHVDVRYVAYDTTDAVTLRHLLLDQVLPRALSLLGPSALHASAVANERGAALFVGPTGRGKSTLAATLAMSGFDHLGDDAVVVRPAASGMEAVPLVAGARLWPEDVERFLPPGIERQPMAGYTPKARIPRGACADLRSVLRPTPLRRIYLVREADDVRTRIEPISADAACVELIRNAFRVALDDPGALRRELELFSDPALLHLVRELHRPQDHARLPEVREAICADLARSGRPAP